MRYTTFDRYKQLSEEHPELKRHPVGAFSHMNILRDAGYKGIGSLNDPRFKEPEGVEICSVHYGNNCYTLYIIPSTKEYYTVDSGD